MHWLDLEIVIFLLQNASDICYDWDLITGTSALGPGSTSETHPLGKIVFSDFMTTFLNSIHTSF